jgi:hypothetical protein
MWKSSKQKWNQVVSVSAEAKEVRDYFVEYVNSRAEIGRENALFEIARALNIAPSRVAKFMRLQITRLWADEYKAILSWHDAWIEREIKRLNHQAAVLKASGEARRKCPV